MKQSEIIKKPIMSEKAYSLMESGIYTFFVNDSATKEQIKKQIKSQFSVEVARVNILSAKSKSKRVGKTRKTTQVGGGKKAIVKLKPGQSIAQLLPKTQTTKSKPTKKTEKQQRSLKDKDVEKVTVEGKEG